MNRTLAAAALAILLSGGCSNAGIMLVRDALDSGDPDVVWEVAPVDHRQAPEVRIDAGSDFLAAELVDARGDAFVECEPGTGCDYEPCQTNDDCQSGICLWHLGQRVCTAFCVEDCLDGWSCRPIPLFAPDLVFGCMSEFPLLCRPCTTDDQCEATDSSAACVSGEGNGSFCGGICDEEHGCPEGYTCKEVTSVHGVTSTQCVPEAGTCVCTDDFVAAGAWTQCFNESEAGLCTGNRICTANGLSDCDAQQPTFEQCNGLDDDCDGEVDEETCDDGNPCTVDGCAGEGGCVHEPQTGTECMDGDPCTVADHCDEGLCVGSPLVCDDADPCTDDACTAEEGCVSKPNFLPCDDGDPCTAKDQCTEGVCAGYDLDCACQNDAGCAALEDGNLCNGTLKCDTASLPYECVVKPGSVVICPEPSGLHAFCNAASCDPATGTCSIIPAHEGFACDDQDACSVGETCKQGMCKGGVPQNCNDGNLCTDDQCDSGSGCLNTNNQAPCNDGNACTLGDSCKAGECQPGLPAGCTDGNPCTDDGCSPATGCTFVPNDAACFDGNACTTGDHCAGGSCVSDALLDCDDSNLCTDDGCAPQLGCLHTLNAVPCDDGNFCTLGDHCQAGVCGPGPGTLACNDDNPCTADTCDKALGCKHANAAGECNDGNACTVGDTCKGGKCVPAGTLYCNDDNVCTNDFCDLVKGCIYVHNEAPCNDGDLCTLDDVCADGACSPGAPRNCNDGNPCTDDACDPAAGCVHLSNDAACSDGNACTVGDFCGEGKCAPGPPLDCNDGNPCTDDWCNPALGCAHGNADGACDDGNACTVGDACSAGQCAAGGPLACDDGLWCNGEESCDPQSGCVPGEAPDPDDGIECTVDVCDEEGDILVSTVDHALCGEGFYCDPTQPPAESCVAQACVPDSTVCEGTVLRTCDAIGSGFLDAGTDCATGGQVCKLGACVHRLGHADNPAISCLAILQAGDSLGDELYWLDPEEDGGPFQARCDMTSDGGGWTRVVVIRSNSIAHGDNTGAYGNVSVDAAPGKLADATINLLNTVGYFRFQCTSQSRYVKNVNNHWTSLKYNNESWSMDRNKDLVFECAANRAGYVFSDHPVCSAGHLNYVAKDGLPEGGGCYHDGSGWGQNGTLWVK